MGPQQMSISCPPGTTFLDGALSYENSIKADLYAFCERWNGLEATLSESSQLLRTSASTSTPTKSTASSSSSTSGRTQCLLSAPCSCNLWLFRLVPPVCSVPLAEPVHRNGLCLHHYRFLLHRVLLHISLCVRHSRQAADGDKACLYVHRRTMRVFIGAQE